jgi:hypothetical protein
MRNNLRNRIGRHPLTVAPLLALAAGAFLNQPANGKEPVDLEGTWQWNEEVVIVAPGEAAALFGVAPEGPVLRLLCTSMGTMIIAQTDDAFSGVTDQSATCTTQGGQPAVAPFPPGFTVTGTVRGHSVHMVLNVGFLCAYRGSIRVVQGEAVAFHVTGQCAPPVDVQPNVGKTISFDATRL